VPSLHVLQPIMRVFESYLGVPRRRWWPPAHRGCRLFQAHRRAEFAMAHDDASCRRSEHATSSSSASRAPPRRPPASISPSAATRPQICRWSPASSRAGARQAASGLRGRPGRQPGAHRRIRRNRVQMLADRNWTNTSTAPRSPTSSPIRAGCAPARWPVIDVTRRSIEETRHHRPSAARP